MTPQGARDFIVALVAHGFDRADLMDMGHAELKWWADGVTQYNREKAKAQENALSEAKRKKRIK